MSALFASGIIIDFILALMVLEGWILVLIHRRTGGGLPPLAVVTLLLPGALLLTAVRAALIGASWIVVGLILMMSLVAHLVDVAERWRDRP